MIERFKIGDYVRLISQEDLEKKGSCYVMMENQSQIKDKLIKHTGHAEPWKITDTPPRYISYVKIENVLVDSDRLKLTSHKTKTHEPTPDKIAAFDDTKWLL